AVAADLLEDGLVALALGDAAGEQRDGAGLVEPDLGALEAGGGGALDAVGEADAGELAALARRDPPTLEAGEIGKLEGEIHPLFELAAVIGEGQPGLERHRFRRGQVAAAALGGIATETVGG